MTPDDWLCEGLPALLRAAASLSAAGVGVVREAASGHAVFSYIDGVGATGYRVSTDDLPGAFRPRPSGIV